MSKDLIRVLSKGAPEHVKALLARNDLDGQPPTSTGKARGIWSNALLLDLRTHADSRLVGLTEDAKRIVALSEGRFDWLFINKASPNDGLPPPERDSLDRSLWFLLHDPETFEEIERRASYERYTAQRARHTHFHAPKGLTLRTDRIAMSRFESAVQARYRAHDGSGLHAVTTPDDGLTPNGDTLHLVTVSLSQLPTAQEEFSNEGKLATRPVRKVTEVQTSYEPGSGDLFVTATRGGYKLRFQVAALFAEFLLGVDEPPEVAPAEAFKLNGALDPAELPAIPGFEFEAVHLVEAEFVHPESAGTFVSLNKADGIEASLVRSFAPVGENLRVLSLTFRIHCRPAGASKTKWLRIKLNEDGSTSLKGDVKLDYELREKIPALWGLRPKGNG